MYGGQFQVSSDGEIWSSSSLFLISVSTSPQVQMPRAALPSWYVAPGTEKPAEQEGRERLISVSLILLPNYCRTATHLPK